MTSTTDEVKKAGTAASKENPTPSGASGDARGGLSSLKDPNQAHENLEIAKNVPVP